MGSAPTIEPSDARVFFARFRAELERRCRAYMDEADHSDDEGAHVGFAIRHRALAAGLNEAILALDEMWRGRGAQAEPSTAPGDET